MNTKNFRTFTWGLLIYNLMVVVWGVYVRASFSGDGCGAHWPLCGGNVVPINPATKTLVEFGHRITSGLAVVLIMLLIFWAIRCYPKGHPVRLGAWLAVGFTFSEALVGAALVLFKWVAHDQSVYRAVAISVHLTNTFMLLGSITLTGWCAAGGALPSLKGKGAVGKMLLICAVLMTVLGITGTIAALGDTLFPGTRIIADMQKDFEPTASYLLKLRPLHPFAAVLVAGYIGYAASKLYKLRPTPQVRRYKKSMMWIFTLQMAFGFFNLMLHAPVWMQLDHLLIADMLWINLVLLACAALTEGAEPTTVAEAGLQPA